MQTQCHLTSVGSETVLLLYYFIFKFATHIMGDADLVRQYCLQKNKKGKEIIKNLIGRKKFLHSSMYFWAPSNLLIAVILTQ